MNQFKRSLYYVELPVTGYAYWIEGPNGKGPVQKVSDETFREREKIARLHNIDVRRTGEIPQETHHADA